MSLTRTFTPAFYSTDWLTDVAKGRVSGHSYVHKFGRNAVVGTTLAPISGSGVYQMPTGTVTLAVVSSDVNDTGAGTGAREITLEYLDADFAQQTATIATEGTTESTATVAGVKRLLRAYVSASGTYATASASSHAGTITIRVAGAGATWATIPLLGTYGLGRAAIGCYTVPAGYTAYLLGAVISVESTKTADVVFFRRENADVVAAPFDALRTESIYIGESGVVQIRVATADSYPEKTDLGFLSVVAAGTGDVAVEFDLLLVAD